MYYGDWVRVRVRVRVRVIIEHVPARRRTSNQITRREYVPRRGGVTNLCCRWSHMFWSRCLSFGGVGSTLGTMAGLVVRLVHWCVCAYKCVCVCVFCFCWHLCCRSCMITSAIGCVGCKTMTCVCVHGCVSQCVIYYLLDVFISRCGV